MTLHLPFGLALGDPHLAGVEQLERDLHRVADFALRRGRDAVAGVERGVDGDSREARDIGIPWERAGIVLAIWGAFVGIWAGGSLEDFSSVVPASEPGPIPRDLSGPKKPFDDLSQPHRPVAMGPGAEAGTTC